MSQLLTVAQMREAEALAMREKWASGRDLMERAGAGVIEAIWGHWPDLARGAPHAVVLCGPGNNGGDGFVVARLLAQCGWQVEVFFMGDAERLSADARAMHDDWAALGPVKGLEDAGTGAHPDLLVDAVFGIGLSRPISAKVPATVAAVRSRQGGGTLKLVAVDCPSGFDVDRGQYLAGPA